MSTQNKSPLKTVAGGASPRRRVLLAKASEPLTPYAVRTPGSTAPGPTPRDRRRQTVVPVPPQGGHLTALDSSSRSRSSSPEASPVEVEEDPDPPSSDEGVDEEEDVEEEEEEMEVFDEVSDSEACEDASDLELVNVPPGHFLNLRGEVKPLTFGLKEVKHRRQANLVSEENQCSLLPVTEVDYLTSSGPGEEEEEETSAKRIGNQLYLLVTCYLTTVLRSAKVGTAEAVAEVVDVAVEEEAVEEEEDGEECFGERKKRKLTKILKRNKLTCRNDLSVMNKFQEALNKQDGDDNVINKLLVINLPEHESKSMECELQGCFVSRRGVVTSTFFSGN